MQTWLTRKLGIDVPLLSAPMARVSEGRLAAAVSHAGALGMIGVGPTATPAWILEQAEVATEPGKPYGIGLMAWALAANPAQLDAVLESDAMVVSVSFGPFEDAIRRLKDAGKVVTTQAGNLADARQAEAAGVDFVVARGGEGGGHGRNQLATLPLLQLLLGSVSTPIVAAGGIANARGLAAVLAAGAVGAWVGTAFLTCQETALPQAVRQRVIAAGDGATVYGRVFDIAQQAAWPAEFGGRALRNRFFREWEGQEGKLADNAAVLDDYARAAQALEFDTAAIYAGEGSALLDSTTTAAEVVAEFSGAGEMVRSAFS